MDRVFGSDLLIDGYRQIIARVHAHGLKLYVPTIAAYERAAYWSADGEKVRFIPKAYTLGAGSTAWLQGTSYKDAQGNTHMMNPSITYRDPIDHKPATTSAGHHERNMLSEMRQEHVLTNTETLMSGKSREQARAGFEGRRLRGVRRGR